jgi:hypothetical protein
MEYAVGVILATTIGLLGTGVGFDKERSFYATVLLVVASYYLLFAAMAKSTDALVAECFPVVLFVAAAALGFRRTPWLLVAGLALHGVFDLIHHLVITNPGVPAWWPGFCMAYDVTAAAYLAVLLVARRAAAKPRQ